MAYPKKKKWTVFFLIRAVDESIVQMIEMINEIRSFEIHNSVSIILCINCHKENMQAIISGKISDLPTNNKKTPTTIFFDLIREPDETQAFRTKLDVIGINPMFNITVPDHLEHYFRQHILSGFKSEHYLLFTWDHGRAYGVFPDDPVDQEAEKINVTNDKERILTMEELNNAILYAMRNRKIDLLVMMNCFTQFIDAGYALHRSVKYLVAPQSSIDFMGYNYSFIFGLLLSKPGISPKKLAKMVVRSFALKVYKNRSGGTRIKEETAVFATDLRYYALLTSQIDKLVESMLPLSQQNVSLIRELRNKSFCISGKNLIDFYTFIRHLESNKLLTKDPSPASLILALEKVIIFEKHEVCKPPFTGFSIFFPPGPALPTLNQETDNFFQTDFYLKTKWQQLVTACF